MRRKVDVNIGFSAGRRKGHRGRGAARSRTSEAHAWKRLLSDIADVPELPEALREVQLLPDAAVQRRAVAPDRGALRAAAACAGAARAQRSAGVARWISRSC